MLHGHILRKTVKFRDLSDGKNYMGGVETQGLRGIERRRKTAFRIMQRRAGLQFNAGHSAVLRQQAGRPVAAMEDNAFLLRVGLIMRIGGHGVAAFQTGHMHALRAQTPGRNGGVHGHVAAADDNHIPGNARRHIAAAGPQELQPPVHVLGLAALQRNPTSGAGTGGQHDSLEAAPLQFLQRNIPVTAHAGIAAEDNAQRLKARHLRRHNGIRQAIGRNAVTQHAAGEGSRFKDRHRIAQLHKEPRTGSPAGPEPTTATFVI